MNRFLLLVPLILLAALTAQGKPVSSDMVLISEQLTSCGYECDLLDGYLGPDEDLQFLAEGSLAPGASYTYTYKPNLGARRIYAQGYAYKGPKIPLQVEIVTERGTAIGIDTACITFYNSVPAVTQWSVIVRNISGRLVKRAYLWGRNEWQRGPGCP